MTESLARSHAVVPARVLDPSLTHEILDVSDFNVLIQFSGLHRNKRDRAPRPGIVAATTAFPLASGSGRALIPRSITLYPAGDAVAEQIARDLVEDLSAHLASAPGASGHEGYHAMLCAIPASSKGTNWRSARATKDALVRWLQDHKKERGLELEVEHYADEGWVERVRRFSLSPEHRWVVSGLAGTLAQQVALTSSLEILGASVSTLWQPHDSDTPQIYSPRDENSWRRDMSRMRHLPAGSILLLRGETGVGKSFGAKRLHALWSDAAGGEAPFVKRNCASIPADLLESELFGHEKGAFTGAHQHKKGAFELAQGGTLFLDEIGELDLALQAKLLTALDTDGAYRYISPVGGSAPIATDARILFGTNRDPHEMVAEGSFRGDLLARISDHVVHLPPLRHRRHELIEGLAMQLESQLARYTRSDRERPIQGVVFSHAMRRVAESFIFDEQHRFTHNHRTMRAMIERVVFRAVADLRDHEALGVKLRAPRESDLGEGDLLVIDEPFSPIWEQICEDVLATTHPSGEHENSPGGNDHSRGWLTEGERERLIEVMGQEHYDSVSEIERLEAHLFLHAREREESSSGAMRWLEASGLVAKSSSSNKSDAFRRRYAKLLGKYP